MSSEESQAEFGAELEPHFHLPARLKGKSDALISAANDFHYAMDGDGLQPERGSEVQPEGFAARELPRRTALPGEWRLPIGASEVGRV